MDLVAKGETATDAYKRSGHKATKSAGIQASQKLNTPIIQEALEKRRAYFRSIADVDAKDIIGAQAEIAFASIEDAMDDEGVLDFAKAKENGSAKLIKKISRQQTKYGETVAVEFYSRTDALAQLADILGIKQKPRENDDTIQKWQTAMNQLMEQGVVETAQEAITLLKSVGFEGLNPSIEQSLITQTVQ